MAPEERDRMFDRALARHLRSAAPANEAAGVRSDSASQSRVCPDPETLAAYHERSLLPEQLNSLKEHIVGCANCQTVLAHLEITDGIPLQAAKEEQVLAQTAAAPAAAVSSPPHAPLPSTFPIKSRRARLLRGARWQWLAPAGAIAAGLLVWIALHENPYMLRPSLNDNESKIAKSQAPPPIPPGAIPEPQASAPAKPSVTLTRPELSARESAVVDERAASGVTRQVPRMGGAAGARSADSLADKELRARKDHARDVVADQLIAANRADLDAKNLPDALRKQEEAQAAKLQAEIAQNSQNQNQMNNYVSPKTPGPSPLNQANSAKKVKSTAAAAPAAPSVPPGEVGGAVSSYNESTSLKVASAISNPRLISPPGLNLVWRTGHGGLIEFSKDGGSSWSRQASGVLTDLLTGSAPSDQVCWIVGRVGTVLLTIDGGAHWKVLASPLSEDLGGIRAMDALRATIWNARSTKSFETSDGGLTWTSIPRP